MRMFYLCGVNTITHESLPNQRYYKKLIALVYQALKIQLN